MAARIDHDEAARGLSTDEMPDERGHRLRDVGAEEQDGRRVVEVLQRERQPPVDPERTVARCRGGRHAEPTVVVDPARPDRDPGELAQLVGLLVREATASEDPDGVRPALVAEAEDGRCDEVEGRIPARLGQLTGDVAHQRGREAIAAREELGRRPPLLAEAAPVRREVPSGDVDREPRNDPVHRRGPGEGHRALQRAVRAVGVGHRGGGTRHAWSFDQERVERRLRVAGRRVTRSCGSRRGR